MSFLDEANKALRKAKKVKLADIAEQAADIIDDMALVEKDGVYEKLRLRDLQEAMEDMKANYLPVIIQNIVKEECANDQLQELLEQLTNRLIKKLGEEEKQKINLSSKNVPLYVIINEIEKAMYDLMPNKNAIAGEIIDALASNNALAGLSVMESVFMPPLRLLESVIMSKSVNKIYKDMTIKQRLDKLKLAGSKIVDIARIYDERLAKIGEI